MRIIRFIIFVQCFGLIVCQPCRADLRWEFISAKSVAIEKLRTELPTPKPPLRTGGVISLDGQTIAMPNGQLAFVSQLGQIAEALVPKDQAGVVTLVSYLRDRDPHVRYLVSLALELHLEKNGLGSENFYPILLTHYLQQSLARDALDDLVLRVSKLKSLKRAVGEDMQQPGRGDLPKVKRE